jgi:hypothetical protein
MVSALADRLMQFCANNSAQIAEQWYKALSTNAKTQAYRVMPKETCTRHAEFIYNNLGKIYFADRPESVAAHLLDVDKFAEDHYGHKIPLEQVIYSIILLRRHLWLYAESQALYDGVNDLMQMVENVNRVILVFDYLIYIVAGKYQLMPAHSMAPNTGK